MPDQELLCFTAPWCSACQRLKPELKGLRLPVREIDVELHPDVAEAHNVMSLPTLVLLRAGREVARTTGYRTRERLEKWLQTAA